VARRHPTTTDIERQRRTPRDDREHGPHRVTERTVNVHNAAGHAHILVDVVGYYTGDFTPISPVRVLDTRTGQSQPFGHLWAGRTIDLDLHTLADLPAGAVAVAINLTATNTRSPSFVTAWPAGSPPPLTANLDVAAGRTVAGLALVGLPADGRLSLRNGPSDIDLIADVLGWFDGSSYHPVTAQRIMDTRQHTCGFTLTPGEERHLTVTGTGGVPATGVAAVALNVTAVEPSTGGHLTVYPAGTPLPPSSTLNFTPGATVANTALVGVGSGGQIAIHNPAGTVHVLVDLTGYHTGEPVLSGPAVACPTTDERRQPPPLPTTATLCPDRAAGSDGDYAIVLATDGTTTCEAAHRVAEELLAAPGLLYINGWSCVFDGTPPLSFGAVCSRGNDIVTTGRERRSRRSRHADPSPQRDLVGADYPKPDLFARLTKAEEANDLLGQANIGNRRQWLEHLMDRGFSIRVHRLDRSKREPL